MATKLSKILFGQSLGENNSQDSAAQVEKSDASAIRKIIEVEQKQHVKEQKTDDKLIKAIVELTKQLNKKDKAIQQGGISGWIAQKKSNIKELMSFSGATKALAGKMGIEQNDGSLSGAILGSVLNRSDKNKREKEFAANFSRYTDEGRKLSVKDEKGNIDTSAAAKRGREIFQKLERREKIISQLEIKKKQAESFGGSLSERDQKRLDAAIESKKNISDTMKGITSDKKPFDLGFSKKENTTSDTLVQSDNKTEKEKSTPLTPAEKIQLVSGAREGMQQEYESLSDEEKQVFKNANPEMVKAMIDGSLEELTKISQEQLDVLIKLLKLQEPSEEDRLESGLGKDAPLEIKKEEKKEEMSIFGKIFDFLKGGFAGFFKSALGSFAGIAMKALGPLAGIIGSVLSLVSKIGLPGGIDLGNIFGNNSPATTVPDIPDTKTSGPDAKSPTGQKPSKPSGKPSVLDKVKNVGKIGKNALGTIGRGAAVLGRGALSLAGPAAAVLGAGYAGYQAGGMINDWYEKDGSSIGSDVYDAVDAIKEKTANIFGFESDKEKMQKAEQAASVDLAKKKLERGEKLSPELAAKARISGINVPDNMIIKTEVVKPNEVLKTEDTTVTDTASNSVIERTMSSNNFVEKTAEPSRVEQQQSLQQNTEIQKIRELEKEKLMIAKQQQSSPTIVSSPTNIVNQTSKINTRVQPRNLETSFNNRLRQIYA